MQTDIVLETKTELKTVDAKYYSAKRLTLLPVGGDISKHFFYQKAIESFLKSEGKAKPAISSIFAFPSNDTQHHIAGTIFTFAPNNWRHSTKEVALLGSEIAVQNLTSHS